MVWHGPGSLNFSGHEVCAVNGGGQAARRANDPTVGRQVGRLALRRSSTTPLGVLVCNIVRLTRPNTTKREEAVLPDILAGWFRLSGSQCCC
jgi:hypothetical protein